MPAETDRNSERASNGGQYPHVSEHPSEIQFIKC